MKDETYLFISDVKDKKITARSARYTRTHCGRGGRVRFPSDNLSKKELEKMNGECKTYRLNSPMAWKEFKAMPDEHKITYIKLVREKYGVSDTQLGKAMGINCCSFSNEMARLGLNVGVGVRNGSTKWDKEGFLAWWHGVDALPTPIIKEVPCADPVQEEPERYAEDDLPFEEPDPIQTEESVTVKAVPEVVTPINGSMQFKCPADQALNTLAQILGQTNCAISIMWRVIEEGGEAE